MKNLYKALVIVVMGIILSVFSFDFTFAQKPNVIISTDIGGNDPDDFQSMVHVLVNADRFNLIGLVSSPPYKGRLSHIMKAIDAYEKDFPKLRKQSREFPTPDYLRSISKQGAIETLETEVPDELSEGAEWIIKQTKEYADEHVYVLVWGSITDVAQAVHADPSIQQNLRVYSIGSWNTVQDPASRDYLYNNYKNLWWIENNTTFRGMYMGGYQIGDYDNLSFVKKHVKDFGHLGRLFWEQKKNIKMGDTPSVLYLMHGNPDNPESESWGGSFVKTGHAPYYWTDNPDEELIENERAGAKTVNRFRKEYLDDWAKRMKWLKD